MNNEVGLPARGHFDAERKASLSALSGDGLAKDTPQVGLDEMIAETLQIISDPKHSKLELDALAYAWERSITFQRKSGNADLAGTALDWVTLVRVLSILTTEA